MSTDLAARQEIADLAVRYAMAVDDHDIPAVLACFDPHGEFVRAGVPVRGGDLEPFWRAMMDRYGLTVHTVHGHLITVAGDTGTGVQAGSAELFYRGTLMRAVYRYTDAYARRDGRWRFARRELRFAYVLPAGEPFPAGPDRIRWPGEDPRPADYPETLPTW